MTGFRLSIWLKSLDEGPGLNRARTLVHAGARRVAFFIDSACVAGGVLMLLTFSLAGFDLPRAARLWGGFWTHYADASEAARAPVLHFILALWLVVTALVAICRAVKHGPALSSEAEEDL